ncbi:MAG: chromosome condensation regulator RCC1 [Actinobacteria bacterium]|nr:chromosome condensation regulator RCC1 [Actinomycetota bacterium]
MTSQRSGFRGALRGRGRWFLLGGIVAVIAVIAAIVVLPRFVYFAPAPFRSAVAAGNDFSCAVTTRGAVDCWGANDAGQLGDGTFTARPRPVEVEGVKDAVAVAAGSGAHACALTGSGAVLCWGANDNGQLGDGTTTTSPMAQPVKGLPAHASAITVGRSHSCALVDRDLYCWGSNDAGELGTGDTTATSSPTRTKDLPGVVAVAAGTGFTCAVTDRGRARCWGDNGDGQLGDGTTTPSPRPVEVPLADVRFSAITAGDTHACALSDGRAFCWGANDGGQLGTGDTRRSSLPRAVVTLQGATSISAGHARTCATTPAGVLCWGNAGADDIDAPAPVTVPGLTNGFVSVAVGAFHACAITAGHETKCWGANPAGQLGDGSLQDRAEPVDVSLT